MTTVKKKPVHYVNNADFLAAIVEYKKLCRAAEDAGDEKPIIPNYLGSCILKIATKLANRPNFINYSYKDDMILDGIENCIQYFDNFNPEKSANPFSYFTQIIYYAFLRRIEKEKKQAYIKGKLIRDTTIESFDTQGLDDDGDFQNAYIGFMQQHGTFDADFEERMKRKKKKKVKATEDSPITLDTFLTHDSFGDLSE
jgi:hypothetical protein